VDDAELFRTHCDAVFRVFANKLTNHAEVDDMIQRTFERFFAAERSRIEQPGRYLLRIAHNLLREHWRKKARLPQGADVTTHAVADMSPGASTLMGRDENAQLLIDGLRTLRLNQQAALELHYWGGLKYREIAEVLEVPEGTVATLISSGKKALRAHIEARHAGAPAPLEESLPPALSDAQTGSGE
jgi:RNA polymerase sigma-70 factor (ECF subfamily)